MGLYGIVNNGGSGTWWYRSVAMVAMLFTAISYGMLARVYPSAGSATPTSAGNSGPGSGYPDGWAMVMDYILKPVDLHDLCSKLTQNILPGVPYWALAIFYATGFYGAQPSSVKTSGTNQRRPGRRMTSW